MQYVVDSSQPSGINIGATGVVEILQNVRMILTTVRGSVPLDREFGLSQTFLDRPLAEAMAAYTGEVVAEVQAQEPRVKVDSVTFQEDDSSAIDGRILPVVTITIKEGLND